MGTFAVEDREKLYTELVNGTVTVTFVKVNGETRVMPCTIKADFLEEMGITVVNPRSEIDLSKTDAVAVYALDAEGWRSFRWDSVLFYAIHATQEVVGEVTPL